MTKAAFVAALALAGCGNYSTEDIRFLVALPTREDLRVAVPATAEAAAVAAAKGAQGLQAPGDVCALGNAELWGEAKFTSDKLNAFVEFLVGLVEGVRRYPPTWREDDARAWGPFDDENHPGREILIGIARTFPEELGGAPRHFFAFQARVKGTQEFSYIMVGEFDGGSAEHGKGWLALDFEALWRLGMNDATTPHGTLGVEYDRAGDPVKIRLGLDPDGSGGTEGFFYQFAGFAAGGGVFDYFIKDPSSNVLVIATRYDAAGAGRAGVAFYPPGWTVPAGWFQQCWDASACLVWVDDSGNHSCDETQWPGSTCSRGDVAACAPVPDSPFPP